MKSKNLSAVSVIVVSMLFFLTFHVHAASAQIKRLGGSDRYQTCSQIVNEGWKTSDYAVIVNGENYPDALSASVLAKKYNAPILLTQDNVLDSNAQYQIKRLGVTKVFIVGGTFVVKPSVENELRKMGISTERFSGADRNETSVAVAKQIGTDNGIILTTDSDFTDALSIAPIAAKLQMPIILMPDNFMPSSVSNFISGKTIPKTYVLGGESLTTGKDLISNSIVSKFQNVQKITGSNKYERNINIIDTFADKIDFSNVCFAYSEKFADALSGSTYAALKGNPIILLGDKPSNYTEIFLKNKGISISNVNILGGSAGIKDDVVSDVMSGNITTNLDDYTMQESKLADVNGDGIEEKVELYKKNRRGYYDYKIIIKNNNTDEIIGMLDREGDLLVEASLYCCDFDNNGVKDIGIRYKYGHGNTACRIYTFNKNILKSILEIGNGNSFKVPEYVLNVKWIEDSKIQVVLNKPNSQKVFLCNNLDKNTQLHFWGTGVQTSFTTGEDGIGAINTNEVIVSPEGNDLLTIQLIYMWDKTSNEWFVKDWKGISNDTNITEITN